MFGDRVEIGKGVVLRRAVGSDFDVTFAIKKVAGGEYIREVFGWDDEVQVGFHRRQFSPENTYLIMLEGEIVGWISVSDEEEFSKVDELYVLAEFQNRGVGTAVLAEAIEQAAGRRVPVSYTHLRAHET